jgi:hypothetical protein
VILALAALGTALSLARVTAAQPAEAPASQTPAPDSQGRPQQPAPATDAATPPPAPGAATPPAPAPPASGTPAAAPPQPSPAPAGTGTRAATEPPAAVDAPPTQAPTPSTVAAAPPGATAAVPPRPVAAPVPAPPAAPSVVSPEDRDRADRALERTLVERGGLLLDAGRFEIVPQISYAHADASPRLAAAGTVEQVQLRRFTGGLTLRLGLPLRLQAEGEFPFVYAQQTPDQVGTAPRATASGSGLGDVRATVTWHLVRSGGSVPDVLVTGFWKSRTGRSALDPEPAEVPLGTGIQQVGGGISLVKAVDPVVLLGSVTVGESVPRRLHVGWIDPGVEVAISTSAILAVSPETSLSFGLDQSYSQTARLAGTSIPGTSQTAAVFNVGFATLASRASLFEVMLGVGLTEDVPRFQISVATPLQF